jgi:quinol monooxygenase YgiN
VTEISPSAQGVTLVNTFRVDPEKQDALVELLVQATDQVIATLPGFLSASFHKSLDGTRVLNYAQWASRDDFEAMFRNPEARKHMLAVRDLASGDPVLYSVVSVNRPATRNGPRVR